MLVEERIERVRAFFEDEISLRIFDKRVEVGNDIKKRNFPENLEFMEFKYNSKENMVRLIKLLREPNCEKFIYGAGVGCRSILYAESMHAIQLQGVVGIIDNNVKEERYGLPVIPFTEFLEKHKNAVVLNSVGMPVGKSIHQQCVEAGVEVISLFEIDRSWDQYFDLPAEFGLMKEDEVFVHAGCYNGDTQKSYLAWFGQAYKKMVTFEPSKEQYSYCLNLFQQYRDVEVVEAGLSDKTGVVRFDLDVPGRSFISEEGTEEIKVVSIDDFFKGEAVSFIALDIEGEEYKALCGARETIKKYKPKLAISIYHKAEDIYQLPELIKSIRPDYKLYLRHYHLLDMAESVLYAV